MTLRDEIARIIDPLNYMGDGEASAAFRKADAILALPEIREALAGMPRPSGYDVRAVTVCGGVGGTGRNWIKDFDYREQESSSSSSPDA